MAESFPHFGTKAIHVGQDPEQWNCKALVPPIFTATTYKQDQPGKPVINQFSYICCINCVTDNA